ncbi:7TM diverse intracellular signaling domain-containing protein [Oligoflexus tunisiensis]|uniref:7TM diverse intracellular signaling domain-containing protein n=1 Tax=Oligoflexus tunisiensis TaxID=708132 RepID=UPI000AEF66A6|nr:7TM diverse intracellular signaling domain-containing protein [Oligoflexus tunisiensis]
MEKIKSALLIAILSLGFFPASGLVGQVRIDQNPEKMPLAGHTQYLMDHQELKDEQVYSGQVDALFQPIQNPNFAFSKEPIWFLLTVTNPSPQDVTWILSFPYSLLDEVILYYRDDAQQIQTQISGDGIPASQRVQPSRDITFNLKEPPDSTRKYYIRIKSGSSLQLAHFAYTESAHDRAAILETLIYALFFGSFIAMGIYNLSIAASTRSKQYFVYSVLVILSVIRESYLAGMGYKFVWPEHPVLNEYIGIFSMAISISLVNAFVMDFLVLKTKAPVHYRILQAGFFISLAYLPLFPFLGYSFIIKPLTLQVLINSIIILIISMIHLRKGYKAARYLIVAWIFALSGWMVTAIAAHGALSTSPFTIYANVIGQFFEIIFLSFALSDKINTLRWEKNQAIRALNKGLEKEVREKTQDIQSILDSIPLGILKIDGEGKLRKGHSKFMEQLIRKVILHNDTHELKEGQGIKEILLSRSNLRTDDIAMIMNILSTAVGESETQWGINAGLLPDQLECSGRIFELIWSPIYSAENGQIQDVLLVIKDVTDLRKIEIESERSRRENEMIIRIVKTRSADFQGFILNIQTCLDIIRKVFFKSTLNPDADDVEEIWRRLHTLKGVSRALGFKEISTQIHEAETCLHEFEGLTKANTGQSIEVFKQIVSTIAAEIAEYQRIDQDVLKRSGGQLFDISSADLAGKVDSLERLVKSPEISREALLARVHDLKAMYRDSFARIARSQMTALKKISEGLGKSLPMLIIDESPCLFDEPSKQLLSSILMHLFRNSLDHGIESPEERQRKGKRIEGSIFLQLEETDTRIMIHYKDDGRGLNIEKIRLKALEKGLIRMSDAPKLAELAGLVLVSGFSTADKITEISGRGVGMDAVRMSLENVGGRIEIILDEPSALKETSFASFRFVIHFPKHVPDRVSETSPDKLSVA